MMSEKLYSRLRGMAEDYMRAGGIVNTALLALWLSNTTPKHMLKKQNTSRRKRPSYWAWMIYQKFKQRAGRKNPKYMEVIENGKPGIRLIDVPGRSPCGPDSGGLEVRACGSSGESVPGDAGPGRASPDVCEAGT